MVFQNYALYPHMTVAENIGFGLRLRRMPKAERDARVHEVATVLSIEHLLGRKPAALSGGQRQRVAMGRAMVREPVAFLMDEPLSNLDAKLRVQMRSELVRLHDRLGTTTVFVTHDQVEAMTLGQRVAVLRDGVLQQVDTPQELYRHPANLFVAAFVGSPPMNLAEVRVSGRTIALAGMELPLDDPAALADHDGRSVILGIRPSDLEDADVWTGASLPVLEFTADITEELGSEVNVLFTVDVPPLDTDAIRAAGADVPEEDLPPLTADRAQFCARLDPRSRARPGQPVRLVVDPSRFHFFDVETGRAIGARTAVGTAG
jgi:multiple sugar transport system ATP-binding protein